MGISLEAFLQQRYGFRILEDKPQLFSSEPNLAFEPNTITYNFGPLNDNFTVRGPTRVSFLHLVKPYHREKKSQFGGSKYSFRKFLRIFVKD